MDVEEEIGELKELLEKNIEVTKDTNRMMYNMRRSNRLAFMFQILWWLFIAGVTGAAYYYFVQPYIVQIQHLYSLSQNQSQNWNEQVINLLKFFGQQSHSATSTSTTTLQ